MNRITKWVAVALLVAAGSAFGGATASAAERGVPIQTGHRGYHRAPAGGWNHWGYRSYNNWHYGWHRR